MSFPLCCLPNHKISAPTLGRKWKGIIRLQLPAQGLVTVKIIFSTALIMIYSKANGINKQHTHAQLSLRQPRQPAVVGVAAHFA